MKLVSESYGHFLENALLEFNSFDRNAFNDLMNEPTIASKRLAIIRITSIGIQEFPNYLHLVQNFNKYKVDDLSIVESWFKQVIKVVKAEENLQKVGLKLIEKISNSGDKLDVKADFKNLNSTIKNTKKEISTLKKMKYPGVVYDGPYEEVRQSEREVEEKWFTLIKSKLNNEEFISGIEELRKHRFQL